jgi:hypothetical protein
VAISDGPLTRPLMNLHSAIPVLTVMNFHLNGRAFGC